MSRLKWELEWQVKGYSVRAQAERRAPLPQWFLDEPVPSEATRFYVASFWELSTERHVGMALGEIPESAVRSLAARTGLQGGNMTLFRAVTRALDGAYLDHAAKRRKAVQGDSTP